MEYNLLYVLLMFSIVRFSYQIEDEPCKFVQAKRTYFCTGITDKFPSAFYGSYHLKCVDCRIPIFSAGTFPTQAELVSFNVSNSGIQNITSGAFAVLPMLRYLHLQNNRIFGLAPNAFVNLRQLYELDLDNNELTDLSLGVFNGLESVSVSMSGNRLKKIPPNVFQGVLGILALNFSHNHIGILYKESFKSLENLEVLDLNGNNICYIPLGIFQYIQSLKELNLAGNKLRSFVPGSFSALKNLVTLNLGSNDFSEFDASVLLPLVKLSNLDISSNSLSYLDAHSVHTNAPTIRSLIITDNLWGCSLLTNLVQYFKSVNIDTSVIKGGRYDVTNVNGVMCAMEAVTEKIPFAQYELGVEHYTNKSIIYC